MIIGTHYPSSALLSESTWITFQLIGLAADLARCHTVIIEADNTQLIKSFSARGSRGCVCELPQSKAANTFHVCVFDVRLRDEHSDGTKLCYVVLKRCKWNGRKREWNQKGQESVWINAGVVLSPKGSTVGWICALVTVYVQPCLLALRPASPLTRPCVSTFICRARFFFIKFTFFFIWKKLNKIAVKLVSFWQLKTFVVLEVFHTKIYSELIHPTKLSAIIPTAELQCEIQIILICIQSLLFSWVAALSLNPDCQSTFMSKDEDYVGCDLPHKAEETHQDKHLFKEWRDRGRFIYFSSWSELFRNVTPGPYDTTG